MSARRITRRRLTDELVVGLPFLMGNRQGGEKPTSSLQAVGRGGERATKGSEHMRSSRRFKPRRCRQCGNVRDGICFPTSWNKECRECTDGPNKFCVRCGQVKPKKEFTRSRERWKDGLFPYCRACLREARREPRGISRVSAAESLRGSLGIG